MVNYAEARKSMVDSQIHTMGVISDSVLNAFRTVPRELFLPANLRSVAYVDEDLPLGDGLLMMEPALLARMVQATQVAPDAVVLNIGDSTGYSSTILSMLATTVITVEARNGQLESARSIWADYSYCNVAVINGDVVEGCPEHAPYHLIFMNGSVPEVPGDLLAQLSVGGRLIAVVRPAGAKIGMVTITERVGEGKYATQKLFDASTPYIHGFEPKPDFVF